VSHRSPVSGAAVAWVALAVGQFAAVNATMQRSSLGVAATDAYARFGIAAATLATFTVIQLVIYAGMQVPVGVLIDRYGSKRLIIAGSLILAGAQALFAVTRSVPLAFAARMILGVGDALTFISVMRLVPAWFPPQRAGKITMAIGPLNQLGFIASATVLAAALGAAGWMPSFLLAAGISVCTAAVVAALLRDAPQDRPRPAGLGQALAVAAGDLRAAWAEPGTRLAFWLGFLALFPPMMFGVMWGYPFLVSGEGVSRPTAAVLMAVLALSGLGYGLTVGEVMERYPYYRSRIAIGLVGLAGAVWAAVLLWPGPAPLWLLVVLVLAVAPTGIAAIMTFDFARAFNPPQRLGSAIGLVNVGAFAGTLTSILAIGLVLQLVTPAGSTDYSLTAFKWAFATQYPLWALGAWQTLRWRLRTEALLAQRDPEALAALRRGIHLPPPA
jgi:MFS family permease